MRLPRLLAAMTIASIGCGGSATGPSPLSAAFSESLTLKVETAHFRLFGSTTPDATLRAAADRLEAEYPRILSALGVVPYLFLGFIVGALMDRRRRQRTLVVTSVARAAVLAAIPVLLLLDALTFWSLAIVILLLGVLTLFADSANPSTLNPGTPAAPKPSLFFPSPFSAGAMEAARANKMDSTVPWVCMIISLPVMVGKQIINVIQMKKAASWLAEGDRAARKAQGLPRKGSKKTQ